MKMRTVKITSEFLIKKLAGDISFLASNFPKDAELLDLKYDLKTGKIELILRSESFEDIQETYPIPEFELVFTNSQKQPTLQNEKPKRETKLTSKDEDITPIKGQVRPHVNASLLEEEFSLEQRELLSFSMEGDLLLVKPVKFLKGEWDDINDVVRSLGGKWVRGDIISYWEIPLRST